VYLICTSEDFTKRTIAEVEKQLAVLPTRDIAALSWRDNGIVHVADGIEEVIRLSDEYAPEHLELHVEAETERVLLDRLTNYGSLFVGEETTVAYGDKSIGTNHILPTSRAARYTGGVWVGKFLKTCTYQRMTPAASREVGAVTERQCNVERMLAHAITARVRVERYAPATTIH
jgi:sulfopropanediol 3-dehydrogenase